MSSSEMDEIRKTGELIQKIAQDANSFRELVEAHDNEDSKSFQAVLARFDLSQYCEWICFWVCYKKCVLRCEYLCPIEQPNKQQIEIEEMRAFALETPKLVNDEETLRSLIQAHDGKDAKTFQEILKKLKLLQYCRQTCSWFCHVRCRKSCIMLCLRPQITHVGRINVTQFTPQHFANGQSRDDSSDLYADTPSPNPGAGIGDHPFGGLTEIHGIFNVTNPDQYKVEYYKVPGGPTTPILDPVVDMHPDLSAFKRNPSTPDGWYKVSEMDVGSLGRTLLTQWNTNTVSDGEYRLKLTVKKGTTEFTSTDNIIYSPVSCIIDNTFPAIDQPKVFIEKDDKSVVPLGCCGEIKRGDGIIQIHIRATDENFSYLYLRALGGCSGSTKIRDLNSGNNFVERYYDGVLMDKGEPVTRIVRWDPWKGPEHVDSCCYVIWMEIWDRPVVGNKWAHRHRVHYPFVSIKIC